jgi:hypothetical protein
MNYKKIKKKKLELTRDTGYDTKITTYKVKIMKSLINHILKYKIREININFLIKVNY